MSRDPDSFNVKLTVLGILVAGAILFAPSIERDKLRDEYDSLQEQYENLETEKDALEEEFNSFIYKSEDYLSTLYEYFEEESIPFSEAYDAYDNLSTLFYKYIH